MKKVSLYDVERMCVRAVNILGLDYPDYTKPEKQKNAFKIVLEISGVAKVGFGKDAKRKEITNERVEVRLFGLSNYKSVYWKVSEEMYEFLYGYLKDNRMVRDCMEYQEDFWFRKAYHSSCWTEGFSFNRHFDDVTDIKIVEVGLGTSSYVEPIPSEENDHDYYLEHDKKIKALLGDFAQFEGWEIDSSNEYYFWSSFMLAMASNGHQKFFRWSFSKSVGEGESYRYLEREAFIYYNYNNEPIVIHTRTNRNKRTATIQISPFNNKTVNKYFVNDGFQLNFFDSFNFSKHYEGYLGSVVNALTDDGYEVTVKRDK